MSIEHIQETSLFPDSGNQFVGDTVHSQYTSPLAPETVTALRESSERLGIEIAERYQNDQFFWLAYERNSRRIYAEFDDVVRDKDILQAKALRAAFSSSVELAEAQKNPVRDPVLGIWSRIAFDYYLAEVMKPTYDKTDPKFNMKTACIVVDVDDLKKINDAEITEPDEKKAEFKRKEHYALGTEVLRTAIAVCKETLREYDMLARLLGGDEIGIIMIRIPQDNTRVVPERLEAIRKEFQNRLAAIKVTISIGFTYGRDDDETIEEVQNRAVRNIYHAKYHGRNQIADDSGTVLFDAEGMLLA